MATSTVFPANVLVGYVGHRQGTAESSAQSCHWSRLRLHSVARNWIALPGNTASVLGPIPTKMFAQSRGLLGRQRLEPTKSRPNFTKWPARLPAESFPGQVHVRKAAGPPPSATCLALRVRTATVHCRARPPATLRTARQASGAATKSSKPSSPVYPVRAIRHCTPATVPLAVRNRLIPRPRDGRGGLHNCGARGP